MNAFEVFINKIEVISDNVVGKFYNETLVNKVESIDFMRSFVNSSFIKGLQKFGEGWFKKVFVVFGYIAIIFGFFSLLVLILDLNKILNSPLFMISGLIQILISFISIILGIGMIKFKKWYLFTALIFGILNLFLIILTYLIFSNSYYAKITGYGGIGNLILNFIIFLFIFAIFFALVIRNKELFSKK